MSYIRGVGPQEAGGSRRAYRHEGQADRWRTHPPFSSRTSDTNGGGSGASKERLVGGGSRVTAATHASLAVGCVAGVARAAARALPPPPGPARHPARPPSR